MDPINLINSMHINAGNNKSAGSGQLNAANIDNTWNAGKGQSALTAAKNILNVCQNTNSSIGSPAGIGSPTGTLASAGASGSPSGGNSCIG